MSASTAVDIHDRNLDFRSVLSLDYLLEFWRSEAESNTNGLAATARELNAQVAEVPELYGAVTDLAVLERHEPLVKSLLTAVFPASLTTLAFTAVAAPTSWRFLHATPRFRRELIGENQEIRGELLIHGIDFDYLRNLFGYLVIMRHCYGVQLSFEKSLLVQNTDPETGFLRTFQIRAQFDLLRVRPIGELPEIDLARVDALGPRMTSLQAWRELVPADAFEFYGLVVYEATDVSEESNRSQLKDILVKPEPLVEQELFSDIQVLLQTMLKAPRLQVAVVGIQGDSAFCISGNAGLCFEAEKVRLVDLLGESCRSELCQGQDVFHPDLLSVEEESGMYAYLRGAGARCLVMLPLKEGERLLGALCLTTDQVGELNSLTKLRLEGMTELFAQALGRTLSTVHSNVQSVMKEKFTAIHPSVEWKFREAATRFLRDKTIGDVVFPGAYSLYSSSDIRSSSEIRSRAIRKDLIQQIRSAKHVLELAVRQSQIDYLDSLVYRLDRLIGELEMGARSGDESRIARLLATEIEPVFDSVEHFGDDIHSSVESYRAAVCSDSGSLFGERRAYEESVDRLTRKMAELLQERQLVAQKMFPHLFEMYRTDGVEHTIYVGDSLTERDDFSQLYLNELRLWQLKTVCQIAQLCFEMETQLPQPLEVAHLILAQSEQIGLRYSQDEKKFNVDGAYNTSYEIIKKRIDKAHVKGTDERLTQPGKVALVYSQSSEALEYRMLVEYLQQKGLLEPGIEQLDLEDLQGVYGLKALRVAVSPRPLA